MWISKKIHLFVSQTYTDYYIKYLKKKQVLNVGSCFDIGSDLGTLVNELNKIGIDAEGIEQKQENVVNAITPKIIHGTFNYQYTTSKKYDLITLPQVIYFLGDILEVLKKIKSMLNPNGMVLLLQVHLTQKIIFQNIQIINYIQKNSIMIWHQN